MVEYVKIPKDRVGVLVGTDGLTKAMLEKKCKVKLEIGHEGDVSISSKDEDGLAEWKALDVVKAIGRGFNPRVAINLLKEDYVLSVIDLYEVLRRKEADVRRVKARVIGEKGKAWRTIELLTNTRLSVYGKTIAIMGLEEDVSLASRGISMIIDGASHANVYRFLERERSCRKVGV